MNISINTTSIYTYMIYIRVLEINISTSDIKLYRSIDSQENNKRNK